MESLFVENYVRTWTQSFPAAGFQWLLRDGANFFVSDGHEYWNNAPTAATAITDTWTAVSREAWWGWDEAFSARSSRIRT
jgi:hypothetical protein